MSMKWMAAAVAGAVFLGFAQPALCKSEDGEEGRHSKHGDHGDGGRGLNLTDEQKEKYKAIRQERKDAGKAFREQMKGLQEKLRKEVDAEKPNEQAVTAILTEMETAHKAHHEKSESIRVKLKQLLTPLQRAKLALKFGHGGKHGRGDHGGRWEKGDRGEKSHHGKKGKHDHRSGEDEDEDEEQGH